MRLTDDELRALIASTTDRKLRKKYRLRLWGRLNYRKDIDKSREKNRRKRAVALDKPGHRERINRSKREWSARNKDRTRQHDRNKYNRPGFKEHRSAYYAEWYQRTHATRRKYMREYERKRKLADPGYAMMVRLRSRLGHALLSAKTKKADRFNAIVGCTPAHLARHIESKFQPGMSWDNRRLWHLGHIIPCAAFDFTDPKQQRACFHFSNIQPLWAADNRRKSGPRRKKHATHQKAAA